MRFFLSFCRARRIPIVGVLLSALLLAVIFVLYRFPASAFLYPVLLCAALWAALFLWDLFRSRKKHRRLRQLAARPESLTEDAFPASETPDDADYQALLRSVLQRQDGLREEMQRGYDDMADYYTAWTHQIKTPIASMRLTLQNEDSALTRRLSAELFRIEQYVEMVMAYQRLDRGASDYVIREADLDTVVRGAVRKFSAEFIDRRLKLDYRPSGVRVLTDEKWLSFVIEQLLSNALKYTLSGTITIDCEPEATLLIRDTGIGIAEEDLPRIFERGYTGENGRLDKRASGIGLWLCARICRSLGHTLRITSAVGEGTCVRLDLSRPDVRIE